MKQGPVVIIGASSAGLLTAYLLAREGVPVSVYEQAERLAPLPRTLIVTSDVNLALGFVPETAIINKVHTFELHTNRKLARITLRDPDLVMDRAKLIRLLVEKGEKAGAQIHFGCHFAGLERDRDRTLAILNRPEGGGTHCVEAEAVVGADGAASQVARTLGKGKLPSIALLQARVSLPPGSQPGVSQVWFAPQDTQFFYWLIPESPTSAVVGLVSTDQRDARTKLDIFLRERGLEPIEYQSALIPAYRPGLVPRGKFGSANVLLVGDAAGQVKMTTVGGTVTGAWGAQAATGAILGTPKCRRELQRLNRELNLHWLFRSILNRFGNGDYDALLGLVNGRIKGLLETRNRDVMAGVFWHLLAAQPRFLLVAAKALMSAGSATAGTSRELEPATLAKEMGSDVQRGA